MTDLPVPRITPATALRTAIFTLSVTYVREQMEQALTVAAARGVNETDLARLRADWEADRARCVQVIGGAA